MDSAPIQFPDVSRRTVPEHSVVDVLKATVCAQLKPGIMCVVNHIPSASVAEFWFGIGGLEARISVPIHQLTMSTINSCAEGILWDLRGRIDSATYLNTRPDIRAGG